VGTAYARAQLVVLAKVDTLGRPGAAMEVKVSVQQAWKSPTPALLSFMSDATDCLLDVTASQIYLLFLYRGADGSYWTDQCSGSRQVANARRQLIWLKRHARATAVTPAPR
jgi:hypothetical protein